jgi:hypothetical protein
MDGLFCRTAVSLVEGESALWGAHRVVLVITGYERGRTPTSNHEWRRKANRDQVIFDMYDVSLNDSSQRDGKINLSVLRTAKLKPESVCCTPYMVRV